MILGKVFYNGIIDVNRSFVQVIGMCPTLAVTSAAINGLGMGLSTTVVLACSNVAISLLRKVIPDKKDILDYMSSTELAENLFRITQTDEVLKNKNINNEDDACITHHKVGQAVRQTIKKIGGTMPEDLPTPSKSAKQIEKEKQKELKENNKKKLK